MPFNAHLVSERDLPVLIIPYRWLSIFFFQRTELRIDRPQVSEPLGAPAHIESRSSLP